MPDGANDRIADLFTRHALDLQRLAAQEQRQVRSFLRDLEGELVAATARVDPTGVSRPSARQNRLENLLEQVRDTIRASFRGASSTLRGELRELAEIEAGAVARMINQGAGFQLADASLTRNQARELIEGTLVQGSPVSDWMREQAGDTLERFRREMRMGIAEGETNAQLVRRIRGGTQNGAPVTGFMETSRRNAEALARSATQAVAQAAKDRTYEQNSDVLKGMMWMATLDNRTTVGCAVRDGLLYEIGTHEPIDHSLPWDGGAGNRHFGCRSTSAPVTKSFRDLGIDADEVPAGTRASMDGQVASDTSFGGWLERQSKARQDDVLGPGRAELWRDGKIGFRDLVDGQGRELTLEQLRARI